MTTQKKTYSKPQLKQVKLLIEDSVLSLCRRNADKNTRTCTSGACAGRASSAS